MVNETRPLDEIGTAYWTFTPPHADTKTDTREDLETPEGAIVHLRPAGLAIRAAAFIVDEFIKFTIMIGTNMVILLVLRGPLGLLIVFLCFFVVQWFYGVLFEVFNDGRTPGKAMTNLRVVNSDGTPIRLPASLIRNIVRLVDTLLFCVPAAVSMAMSRGFRRIGDLVADTIVIYTEKHQGSKRAESVTSKAIPINLTAEEQILLIEFQDRMKSLSQARAIELAEILEPVHRSHGKQAVEVTLGYAQAIRGST